MKPYLAVMAVLLTLPTGACSHRGPSAPPISATPAVSASPLVDNGVVVNELEVLEGDSPAAVKQELDAVGGVVLTRDARLGTLVVWFPTHDLAHLTTIKDTLASKHITANLVFPQPPTS
ncbi:hypothetical protein [Actinoplanes subtropicus]|uniref:hypothetical protein n=1 Tax=Actinoplanes subtropicus TaxID=543632 RepID=UPI000A631614|nr:hypothetical protein [Actinoplanes subtropicus]